MNLGTLGFFKYYDFFRESLDDALATLGLTSHLPALQIVLPIGISFYCFHLHQQHLYAKQLLTPQLHTQL